MPLSVRAGLVAAASGGALGALVRWALTDVAPAHGTAFPWTVLLINVVGSGLLALLGTIPAVRRSTWLPVFLGTGVMGGFTTMSTASVDTVRLLDAGATATAAAYAVGTLAGALLLVGLVRSLAPGADEQLEAEEGAR